MLDILDLSFEKRIYVYIKKNVKKKKKRERNKMCEDNIIFVN